MIQPHVMHWDLHARNAATQRGFYTELFDWNVTPEDDLAGYGWFRTSQGFMLGGVGQAGAGESPGFSIFIQVDNVAACISEALRLGGAGYWGPRTFDDGMTTACIADPDGNGVLLIAPGPSGEPYASRPSCAADRWSWEIHAADPERLLTFCAGIFGWSAGNLNEWGWAAVDTGEAGGSQGAIARADAPCVMVSIAVDDLDSTLSRATQLGARTIVMPWSVTETYRMAVIEDLEGNRLGLFTAGEPI